MASTGLLSPLQTLFEHPPVSTPPETQQPAKPDPPLNDTSPADVPPLQRLRQRSQSISLVPLEPTPTSTSTPSSKRSSGRRWFRKIRKPDLSFLPHISPRGFGDVTKLVVAFFLACLTVLIKPIAALLGTNAFIVPLSTLYFPPVVSVGAMIESWVVGSLGLLLSAVAGMAAQASVVAANNRWGNSASGPVVSELWLIVCFFGLGWLRAKFQRLSNPFVVWAVQLSNTLILGSDATEINLALIWGILKPLLAGGLVSLVVNLLVWPTTASQILRSTVKPALTDINTLLQLLTRAFLDMSESKGQSLITSAEITQAQNNVRNSLARLRKAEHDAKMEISYGHYPQTELKRVVSILHVMAHHMSSMASCVRTESRLLRRRSTRVRNSRDEMEMPMSAEDLANQINEDTQRSQRAIERLMNQFISIDVDEESSELESGIFGGNKDLFQRFLNGIAPAMKQLTGTCSKGLDQMAYDLTRYHTSLGPNLTSSNGPAGDPAVSSATVAQIASALRDFDFQQSCDVRTFFEHDIAGTVARPVREEFFLAFFFSFGLREFARETKKLADEVRRLEERRANSKRARLWLPQVGWMRWLSSGHEFSVEEGGHVAGLPHMPPAPAPQGKTDTTMDAFMAKRLRRGLVAVAKWFGQPESRFAIKVALSVGLIGFPGVLRAGWYTQIRGVWAVVTMAVVLSPTVGASLLIGAFRVAGTLLGAVSGLAVWLIASGNPFIMAVLTVVWAYPLCWVYMNTSWLRIGVTALFTYAIVLLAAYVAVDNPDFNETIYSLAWKRALTIVLGMVAAIFLNVVVWPYKARIHLRFGVAKTIHEIGILYSSAMSLYIGDPTTQAYTESLRTSRVRSKKLQSAINRLEDLLQLTRTEVRLSSPFPRDLYRDILTSLRAISDRLASMLTMCAAGFGSAREEYILPVVLWRKDMYKQVLLFLHVIAASLKAKIPLPASMPPARVARLRLIAKLQELPKRIGGG
ncbi:hypothetical protein HK104_000177, partial [Borealophlyctis nickersoniae]